MTFAEQLQAERKRLGMTRLQMAELLDVSARTIDYWENGKVVPQAVTQEGVMARTRAVTGVIDLTPAGTPPGVNFFKPMNKVGWRQMFPPSTFEVPKEAIEEAAKRTVKQIKRALTKKPARRKPKA